MITTMSCDCSEKASGTVNNLMAFLRKSEPGRSRGWRRDSNCPGAHSTTQDNEAGPRGLLTASPEGWLMDRGREHAVVRSEKRPSPRCQEVASAACNSIRTEHGRIQWFGDFFKQNFKWNPDISNRCALVETKVRGQEHCLFYFSPFSCSVSLRYLRDLVLFETVWKEPASLRKKGLDVKQPFQSVNPCPTVSSSVIRGQFFHLSLKFLISKIQIKMVSKS